MNTLKAILQSPQRGGLTSNVSVIPTFPSLGMLTESAPQGLVYRYDVTKADDGVGGDEGGVDDAMEVGDGEGGHLFGVGVVVDGLAGLEPVGANGDCAGAGLGWLCECLIYFTLEVLRY